MVARVHAGDLSAFDKLYEWFFPRIYGYVRSLVVNAADAQDVTQHVFEQMWTAATRGDLRDVRSLRQWLFAVARNRALDFQRAHSRVDVSAPSELWRQLANLASEPAPGSVFDDAALADAVRRLPRLQREVVLLRYVEDFDLAEIAAIIGSTKSSVANAHSRALRALRQLLNGP